MFVVVVPSIYFEWISSLPIGHFHTGFLIGIKLIQVRILYVIVDSGAIEIMFILIQSIKDLPKRLVKQQIPLQKNATWNLIKIIGIFRKYILTTCLERELLRSCISILYFVILNNFVGWLIRNNCVRHLHALNFNNWINIRFACCDLREKLAAFEARNPIFLTSVSGHKICRKSLRAISL